MNFRKNRMTQKAIIEKYIFDYTKTKNFRSSKGHHNEAEKISHNFGQNTCNIYIAED